MTEEMCLSNPTLISSSSSSSPTIDATSQTSELSATVNIERAVFDRKSDVSQTPVSEERRHDRLQLRELGYKQELRRGLNAFMNFSFTFTICAVLPGILQLWSYGLSTGGPVAIVWSWMAGSVFMILTALSLGEICSVYPLAGSVYHWTAALVPKSTDGISSWQWLVYITGWNNLFGNVANSASFASGTATVIAAAVTMHNGQTPSTVAQVFIAIGLIWFWALLNMLRIDQQGIVSSLSAVFQIFGAGFIIIVVLILSPSYSSSSFVFSQFYNGTGISSPSYVSAIGLLMVLFAFDGFDAAGHVAEETKAAHRAAPIAMLSACAVSTVSGLFVILGLLYSTPSDAAAAQLGYPSGIDLLLGQNADPTIVSGSGAGSAQQAAVNLFWYVGGLNWGLGLTCILVVLIYCSGASSITAASRITFAMARDGALPFSRFLTFVYKPTLSPVVCVIVVAVLDSLLLLLQLGNTTAFAAIVSISTIGFQLSYAAPILVRITVARKTFQSASFSLGRWAVPCGVISCVWCLATSVLLFLPQTSPVTAANMNYSCAVIGGLWSLAMLYWLLVARKRFAGPVPIRRSRNQQPEETQTPQPDNSGIIGRDDRKRVCFQIEKMPGNDSAAGLSSVNLGEIQPMVPEVSAIIFHLDELNKEEEEEKMTHDDNAKHDGNLPV